MITRHIRIRTRPVSPVFYTDLAPHCYECSRCWYKCQYIHLEIELLKFSLQPFPFVPNALCLGFVSATSMKSSSAFFMSLHENCTCGFCIDGQCKVVFESDMDLHWCMRHLLCSPSKLYSQTQEIYSHLFLAA